MYVCVFGSYELWSYDNMTVVSNEMAKDQNKTGILRGYQKLLVSILSKLSKHLL